MPSIEEVKVKDVTQNFERAYGSWFKSYMKIFCRRALEWFIVYMFGYYSASFGWLMAPLFFLVLRDKRAKEKQVKFDIVRSLANSDEAEILHEIQKFSNLPSWVTFPDMERVEWVNKIIRQLWPYAGHYARDLCTTTIEPVIADALKAYKLVGFKFDKIILGDSPPRLSGIKVYDDTSRHEIIMDSDFVYAGDCKFEVNVSGIKGGIKDLQVSGRVRVVMKPLVKQIPLVGGLQVFFLNNPEIDFNLTGIADVFDMPGLSDILRSIVVEQVANMMVLPNRYPIQLLQDIEVVELKCPQPAGVIRLEVIEAQNLMKKDIGVLGTGKSDPYCVVRLGARKFQTKTINNTVNPKWNFICELIADETSGQSIDFALFDLDDGPGKNERLGRANLDVQSVYSAGKVEMWVPLADAKSGRIHIRATWMELSDDAERIDEQLDVIKELQSTTETPLNSSILTVWVDSATNLSNIPDPFVKLHLGNETQQTVAHLRTNDPVFEEGFVFMVRNPKTQELVAEVIDQKSSAKLGNINIDLNLLLRRKKLEITGEEFSLKGLAGGRGTLKLTITLRVLKEGSKQDVKTDEVSEPPKLDSYIEAGSQQENVALSEANKETELTSLQNIENNEKVPPSTGASDSKLDDGPPLSTSQGETSLRHRQVPSNGSQNLGRIQLTVTYGARNNLVVVVHKVENLPLEMDGEIPDPYVKLYLLPGKTKENKRKTEVIKDSVAPVFDERFEYIVSPQDLPSRTLLVSVVNKKGFFHMQRSGILGQIFLECGALDNSNVTRWYDLNPPTDEDEE